MKIIRTCLAISAVNIFGCLPGYLLLLLPVLIAGGCASSSSTSGNPPDANDISYYSANTGVCLWEGRKVRMCRLIDEQKYERILRENGGIYNHFTREELLQNSKEITVAVDEWYLIHLMWDQSRFIKSDVVQKQEQNAVLVLDVDSAKLMILRIVDAKNDQETSVYNEHVVLDGVCYEDSSRKQIIIGHLHTHPNLPNELDPAGVPYCIEVNKAVDDRNVALKYRFISYIIDCEGIDAIIPLKKGGVNMVDSYMPRTNLFSKRSLLMDALKNYGSLKRPGTEEEATASYN